MINFKKYNNATKIVVPNGVQFTNTNFSNTFCNMQNLVDLHMPNQITNMNSICRNCKNIKTATPMCSNNVVDMNRAYEYCYNLTGSPVCGRNVINMSSAYYGCRNLVGSPVCGRNVTNMSYTYAGCSNLTGFPACGKRVTNMASSYRYCSSLTGSPVCGENVTNMFSTYADCFRFTGSPVCGNKVTDMSYTYNGCSGLTGSPICGENVRNMAYAYDGCRNLASNGYLYSNNISGINMRNCFHGRYTSNRLNLYVHTNSTTLNTCLCNNTYSMVGSAITWTDDTATNNCYYNTQYNIYIYPVENVAAARAANGD